MAESFVNDIVVVVTDVEHPAHGHVHHVLVHVAVGIVVEVLVVVILVILVVVVVIIIVIVVHIVDNVPDYCCCQHSACQKSPNIETLKKTKIEAI